MGAGGNGAGGDAVAGAAAGGAAGTPAAVMGGGRWRPGPLGHQRRGLRQRTAQRAARADRRLGYVLAVAKNHMIHTRAGEKKAIDLAVTLPHMAWNRLSAGKSAKGGRLYDWAVVETTDGDLPGHHHLLVRRNISNGEYAFYRATAPPRSR